MKRMYLIEWEDLDWLPDSIRDGGTDLLDAGFKKLRFYEKAAGKLAALLDKTGGQKILDLCSGGGGGTLDIFQRIRTQFPKAELLLTDNKPNEAGLERIKAMKDPQVSYKKEAVNAYELPNLNAQVFTMAGALHHFKADDARLLFASVIKREVPFAFFDVAASPMLRRIPLLLTPPLVLANAFMLIIVSLLMVPFIRPFRFRRLFFTYAVPLIPALVAWDGTVSAIRAYSAEEVLELAKSVPGAKDYVLEAGLAGQALFITGIPKKKV